MGITPSVCCMCSLAVLNGSLLTSGEFRNTCSAGKEVNDLFALFGCRCQPGCSHSFLNSVGPISLLPLFEIFRCRCDDYIGWSAWRIAERPGAASAVRETRSQSRATLKKKYGFFSAELPPLYKNISFLFKSLRV